ncbi:2OG-Fe(II) oxygenase family protein [Arvimicrobium flavum]|uniref:2OG-Fe(II) oxygenase family protein n=1 Tax=Arvimicrobium flavum TaxID=3393320 RepID=UPI00237B0474|nr:2OG-Fe(II) oxygenase family protein [Mesorhizobium shangrilense]
MIPTIDISPLFEGPAAAREEADRQIMEAASGIGFVIVRRFPGTEVIEQPRRRNLLQVFALPHEEKARLHRWNFNQTNDNVCRGWFTLQDGMIVYQEGMDIGPDIAHPLHVSDIADPLLERTPVPSEALAPGWRAAAAGYYRAMEAVGHALMRSVARALGLHETVFDDVFRGGISTLRLSRYAPQPGEDSAGGEMHVIAHAGERRPLVRHAHVDAGFVTLHKQDGGQCVQVQSPGGRWIDVPIVDGGLTVNFGQLLRYWTGGRVAAALHRIVAPRQECHSIPFFYEPRANAEIAPLPLPGIAPFEPFLYGDYIWDAAMRFPEHQGIHHLREPRRRAR